jgi:hypothetical protein
MTVAELIEKLRSMPQDSPVILADRGGYHHIELVGADDDMFWVENPENPGYGVVNENEYEGGMKCVVLWP